MKGRVRGKLSRSAAMKIKKKKLNEGTLISKENTKKKMDEDASGTGNHYHKNPRNYHIINDILD